ncbi:Acyl-CoA-binding protein 2 [Balamuthia mandrillaris]
MTTRNLLLSLGFRPNRWQKQQMSEAEFQKAAEEAKQLKKRPDNDTLLRLYALYKQATVGDNNTSQPWAVQLEARAKWDAWDKLKGTSQEEARREYVELVEKLKATHN